MSGLSLLPPAPGKCQECAVEHPPEQPHDRESLSMRHGRGATWADAMAHCTEDVQAQWREALRSRGVKV